MSKISSIIATTQKHTIAVTISVKASVSTTAITICMTLMEPHDSHSPEVTASDNALEIYRKMVTESIMFRSIRPKMLVIHSSYNPFSQRKFLLIRITLAHLNIHQCNL